MKKTLYIGLILVASAMAIISTQANAEGFRDITEKVAKAELIKINGLTVAEGVTYDGNFVELKATEDWKQWTLVLTQPSKTGHILASGKDWSKKTNSGVSTFSMLGFKSPMKVSIVKMEPTKYGKFSFNIVKNGDIVGVSIRTMNWQHLTPYAVPN